MSFLVLLLASLSLLTRVEVQSGDTALRYAQAQAHARFAMAVALGTLQAQLGPDNGTSVSASALLGTAVDNPTAGWIGSWRIGEGDDPVWLVSGAKATPGAALAEDQSVELASEAYRGASRAVRVPTEEVLLNRTGPGGLSAASIGWWIDDEAAKVPLHVGDAEVEIQSQNRAFWSAADPSASARARFGLQQSGRPRADRFLPTFNASQLPRQDDLPDTAQVGRYADAGEAALAYSAGGDLSVPPGMATSWSRGLIVQGTQPTRWHGSRPWRANLTDTGYVESGDDAIVTGAVAQARSWRPTTNTFGNYELRRMFDASVAGEPNLTYGPILTEAMLYAHLFGTGGSIGGTAYTLRVRFFGRGEVWNPHSFPLLFPTDGGYGPTSGSNQALRLHFSNLPDVRVILTQTEGATQSFGPINLNTIQNEGSTPEQGLQTWFEIAGGSRNRTLLPGEVYARHEPDPRSQSRGLARTAPGGLAISNQTQRITLQFRHRSPGVSIRLLPFRAESAPFDYDDTPALFEVTGIPFKDFDLVFERGPGGGFTPDDPSKAFLLPTSGSFVIENFTFAYHLRFADEALIKLLNHGDLRRRTWNWGDTITLANGEELKVSDVFECVAPDFDPAESVDYAPSAFSKDLLTYDLQEYTDRTRERSDLRLWDLPAGPLWSLHLLRTLARGETSALQMGEPNGGRWNAAFDRYFFSTVDAATSAEDASRLWSGTVDRLPDPRLRAERKANGDLPTRAELAGQQAAALMMQAGPLPINTTDWQPWRAALGSVVRSYRTQAWGSQIGAATLDLENVFSRHVYGDGHLAPFNTQDDEVTGASRDGVALAQGVRALSGARGSAHLDQLAARIAAGVRAQVRNRGLPFTSIAELADSGLIEKAIDETGEAFSLDGQSFPGVPPINGRIGDDFPEPPRFAPGFLTQGDVLMRLHPALAARSDTFRIRSYGEVLNPITGEVAGRAWAEAVVQRVPEKVDGSDPLAPALTVAESRRLKVVSFRWLSPNEL